MTPERIITAATVTSGEKADGKELPELIKKSRKARMEVENVIADRAYSGKDNLRLANEEDENGKKNFKLISRLNPSITEGYRKDNNGFIYNKDADMMQCPAGELSIRKAVTGSKKIGTNQSMTYYFDIEKCRQCPRREGCYKIEAKNSELKNVLGYEVSMGNCLYATKIQGACTILAANIKRIITILDEKKQNQDK